MRPFVPKKVLFRLQPGGSYRQIDLQWHPQFGRPFHFFFHQLLHLFDFRVFHFENEFIMDLRDEFALELLPG